MAGCTTIGRLASAARVAALLCSCILATQVLGDEPAAGGAVETQLKTLVLGGSQGSHRTAAMVELARVGLEREEIAVDYTEDVGRLSDDGLAQFAAVVIYRDHGDLPQEAERSLLSYVDRGGGLVAIHCASHCFRNSQRYTDLIGGRFLSHGGEEFHARILDAQHPAMRGVASFESWDETYVHNELSDDRRVLMVREHADGSEPYAWVRKQGQGRVYYTALGHDERTWRSPAFHRLLSQAILWAAGRANDDAPPLEYEDVEGLPHYAPNANYQADSLARMQKPLAPEASRRRMHLPEGFRVELFAAEPDVVKPLAMAFDHRGRLWVIESLDYPNTIRDDPHENGRDRIKICEDTDGDGRADKFTVFADRLNIPTSLTLAQGGVIVAVAPHIVLLRDTDGDDRADERRILLTGFGRDDTHAVHSNFRYGHDNWIWATVGYSGGLVEAGGAQHSFRMGLFRFRPDGGDFEFLTSTSNNTWGLGIGEDGDVFASTANNDHSVELAIPNRFYEQVRGWHGSGSRSIADHREFHPLGEVRQVDWHGGFTAASGHAVYGARQFPSQFWNRAVLTCEPTGHLIHIDWLARDGSGFVTRDGYNLLASDDGWTSPIAAEVGPDGAVWFLDWYNYIVQHNPTPAGYETGPGNAYVTPLRDESHGRIYRIVYEPIAASSPTYPSLESVDELVAALQHENLFWRLTAQRLLVERRDASAMGKLADLAKRQESPGAVHALRAMHGISASNPTDDSHSVVAIAHMRAEKAPLQRTALAVAPRDNTTAQAILDAKLLDNADSLVRRDAFLTLAECPPLDGAGQAVAHVLCDGTVGDDPWIPSAAISAAAKNDREFLASLAGMGETPTILSATRVVAEHYARGAPRGPIADLLDIDNGMSQAAATALIEGFANGWPAEARPADVEQAGRQLSKLLQATSNETAPHIAALARAWGLEDQFRTASREIVASLIAQAAASEAGDGERIAAVRQAAKFPLDADGAASLLDLVAPRTPPELVAAVFDALADVNVAEIGELAASRASGWTPAAKRRAVALLLERPRWTAALLDALKSGALSTTDLSLDEQQRLLRHVDNTIAARARTLIDRGGGAPSADRQRVLAELLPIAQQTGDASVGRKVFEQQCAKCHRHGELGATIGPDLSGMAARTKAEILTDVIDPNRSVEGNFRQHIVVTTDGRVLSGLLSGETRASIELLDAEAKKRVVLREDIEELQSSPLSLMPEGFERLPSGEIAALLEFLTARDQYLPLPLNRAATIVSTRGMFYDRDATQERLVFPTWGRQTLCDVPFQLVDPHDGATPNVILLHGPQGGVSREMPRNAVLECRVPARAIHLLSGVAGWAYPLGQKGSVSLIVRLHYADGSQEDHPLRNGEHFADYIRRVDVPGSKHAATLRGQQIRYLAIHPAKNAVIDRIEFIKGDDDTAPIVAAVTVETIARSTVQGF